MKANITILVVALWFLVGCSGNTLSTTTAADSASGQPATTAASPDYINDDKTKQVLEHHWQAFTKNKLDDVMADYTEESV